MARTAPSQTRAALARNLEVTAELAVPAVPAYEPAPLSSMPEAAASGLALAPPVRDPGPSPRRLAALRPPWPIVLAAALGGLAVVVAVAFDVAFSTDIDAAILPAVVVAAAGWPTVLSYIFSWGAMSPLTLGVAVTSAVAGLIGLLCAAAAAMLLPGVRGSVDAVDVVTVATGFMLGAAICELIQLRYGPRRRVLVVGADDGGAELLCELQAHRELPLECIGVIDDATEVIPESEILGDLDSLPSVIRRERPALVVLAGAKNRARAMQRIFEAAPGGFHVVELNHLYEDVFGRVPLRNLTPAWFMGLLHLHRRPYSRASKRAFDLVVAALLLVPVLLLLPFVALLVRCSGPGPIFFRQVRLGEGGKPFTITKFRTMVVNAEPDGPVWASERDPRITAIGRFLRRSRLDELPQLANVLRGEMSIVGPRPERPEFVELLKDELPFWERRHIVKPGITGWAQIRCGYADDSLSAAEKLSHDLYYVKHRSLMLDLAIGLKTAMTVIRGTGAH